MGFDEGRYGSLEQGKSAGFVVLSENPLEMDAGDLMRLEVLSTYIDGKQVNADKKPSLPGMLGGILKGKASSKKYN